MSSRKRSDSEHQKVMSIFDNINEPVYVSDPHTYEILYINNAVREIYGDVVGQLCYRVFQREKSPCPFCTNDRIFGPNEGSTYTWVYQGKINKRWYRCIDKAIPWPDGRMVRYEMAIDITEQKRAEEDLNRFFNLSVDMLCISGFDGYARRLNPAFEKVLGYKLEEILARPVMEFVHPDDVEATMAKLEHISRGKADSNFEQRLRCKDGSYKWVAWTNVPVVEEGLMYAAARDITEHKQMEEELRQSGNRYRTIFENTGSAIIVVEEDTTICFVNEEFVSMSGYSRDELIGRMSWTDFFGGDDLARMKEYHRLRRIDPASAPRNYEAAFIGRDRREISIFVTVAIIPGTRRSIGSFQDISEMKETEKALKKAKEELERQNEELKMLDRIRDGIIRDVSHELKTPVAKLSMQLEILNAIIAGLGCEKHLKKPLEVMGRTVHRQEKAISSILDLSRLESGGRKGSSGPVDLAGTLALVIQDHSDALEAMNIEVAENLEQVEIVSDGDMLWHVFSNLFNNAIKFSKKDAPGKIDVTLGREDHTATVRIRDNGIGMTAEEAGRVFERFYQASPSIEGCGVGLSICKMIVEELGGSVRIESEGSGCGTTATVVLPLSIRSGNDEN